MIRDTKKIFKILSLNIIVFATIFLIAEIFSRLFFPEFGENREINFYHQNLKNKIKTRVPNANYNIELSNPLFLTIGDSITNGYGMSFEDIYWVKIRNKYLLSNRPKLDFLSLSGLGTNYKDSFLQIKTFIENYSNKEISYILYQFNFNDITPYTSEKIKEVYKKQKFYNPFLGRWRAKHLNKSRFFRIVQHYGGSLFSKKFGSCEDRGIYAMNYYTYTYGSKNFENISNELWIEFYNYMSNIKKLSEKVNAELIIFISPLRYDIDINNKHRYSKDRSIDLNCATIKPRERLINISKKLNITYIDPTNYLRNKFEQRIKENNYVPFYFASDDNHINPIASEYIADYIYSKIFSF